MKYYIAAPFFNEIQLKKVIDIECWLKSHNIGFFSPRSFGVIKDMTPDEKEQRMEEVYNMNIQMIEECWGMIVIVDDKDTGTLFELGYAAAYKDLVNINRIIITMSFESKPVNLMLRYCINTHCTSIEELEDYILKNVVKLPQVNE